LDCILPRGRFFPAHVLDCLCGVVTAQKVALIVFVSASEEFGESTAAAQYFLQMAVQTGIPIIAWNADNAGFTFPKVFEIKLNLSPIATILLANVTLFYPTTCTANPTSGSSYPCTTTTLPMGKIRSSNV